MPPPVAAPAAKAPAVKAPAAVAKYPPSGPVVVSLTNKTRTETNGAYKFSYTIVFGGAENC